jgi:hypothetical protein
VLISSASIACAPGQVGLLIYSDVGYEPTTASRDERSTLMHENGRDHSEVWQPVEEVDIANFSSVTWLSSKPGMLLFFISRTWGWGAVHLRILIRGSGEEKTF